MEDEHNKIKELLQRYRAGQCSPEEIHWLELQSIRFLKTLPDVQTENLDYQVFWQEVYAHIEAGKRVRRMKKRRERLIQITSAALLLIVASIVFYSQRQQSGMSQQATVHAIGDIAPGGNRAFLTLADGRRIALDSIANGTLALQAGMEITKTADGEVAYHPSNTTSLNPNTENPIFNTITTPKGGQYQVTLPDGTKVWLNAASSLRFPATFDGMDTRTVEVTGEAYFEVVHQSNKPFLVSNQMQNVEVLGTHFNVNAYADEPVAATTLLEGKVNVTAGGKRTVLKPGQQAVLQGGELRVLPASRTAIAWKNGDLEFYQANLRTILREASRWYSFTVIYEGNVPTDETLAVSIPRDSQLSVLLEVLEGLGVNFRMEKGPEGARLVVSSVRK